ncbi:MAG: NTP transferase domain-containing protein [Candidatus Diapherotrites archaeon]|nr:NTP transferase domain-containing protein [Candidatus Diapherotrites archaeon]
MVSTKERVTITISRLLLKSVDRLVDGRGVRNRSHAIEHLVSKGLGESPVRTAFILAGGRGERLKPLTDKTPKPLLPVAGKPMLVHIIEWLAGNGIERVILGVGYRKDEVKKFFDGKDFGVEVLFSEEDEPLGTGGCLVPAKHLLNETFVMMNGDVLTNFSLRDMVLFHKKQGASVTIALKEVDDPTRFGVAELEGSMITRFIEKPTPEEAPSHLINAGVYVVEPAVLDGVVNMPCSIERDVFPGVASRGGLYGYIISSPWIDIGTYESLKAAEVLFK